MSDEVLGRGVIELVADARKLQAGIAEAKKSIRTLGEGQKDVSKSASASIDAYITRLQVQQKTMGMSSRETELYRLAVRGASNEQIKLADSTLRTIESQERFARVSSGIKAGLVTIGTVAVTSLIAAATAFNQLAKNAGDFQDMAEKTGDSAANFASLAVAAQIGNVGMDSLVSASVKLTKNLTGVDDESSAAGAAIKALGLDLQQVKGMAPAEQFETIAQALDGFADGSQKSAVAVALFGKSGAEMLPFLKELGSGVGRVNILTSEQIRLADEYADKQAKTSALISQHAQAIAAEMLPAFADLTGATLDLIKGISGVGGEVKDLSGNNGVKEFADKAVYSIAFIVDAVDGLVRVFQLVGTAIAGAAAIAMSPWDQAKTIYNEMSADINKTLMRPMMRQGVEKRQADRKASEDLAGRSAPLGGTRTETKSTLRFGGATKKSGGGNSGDQIAKAQLSADLDAIKKSGAAQINTFANAEKIMEARRAAGLLDEREYYAAKLSFLNANAAAQEKTLQEEITRLGSEKAVGKDRIDNQRKIADLQGEITKIRENASANTEVLAIQEVAANKKIAQSYIDATIAAQAYIKTITDRNAREIAGVGRGNKFRAEQDGRNQIEDKLTVQRQTLERDLRNNQITQKQFDDYLSVAKDSYAQEVALYNARTDAINALEKDWVNGATEAFANYLDEVGNVAQRTEDAFTKAFQGTERAMSDYLFDPFESGVDGMLKSIGNTLKRIVADFVAADLNKRLVGGLSGGGGLSSLIGTAASSGYEASSDTIFSSAGTGLLGLLGKITGRASGGPVSAGQMYRVNERRPELLNIAGSQYLMMGSQSGSVDPNTGSSGNAGHSFQFNFNGPTTGADVRRAAGQAKREILAALSDAGRYA